MEEIISLSFFIPVSRLSLTEASLFEICGKVVMGEIINVLKRNVNTNIGKRANFAQMF